MTARLIRGDVVTPGEVIADGALVVEQGTIREILRETEAICRRSHEMATDDYRGRIIFPGAVDAHVHSFSDPSETFVGSTRAAAAGGVTTIIDMPYDVPHPINTPESVDRKIERVTKEAYVDVALHGTVAPGASAHVVENLVRAGVCGFKLSMFETDPTRFPRIGFYQLREVLVAARELGVTVGVHAEEGELIRGLVADLQQKGLTDPISHCRSRPPESETIAVAAGIALAESVAAPFHIFHASVPASAQLALAARDRGADVSTEICPHYLVLDESDMDKLGARGKINPPLRSAPLVERNWRYLSEGGFDMVTSDHAPWPISRKSNRVDIFANASGAPGVQLLVPLILGRGWLGGRLTLLRCAELLAENPARRFNLAHRKGGLSVGRDADYIVFNPSGRTEVRADTQYSMAGWSPYDGWSLAGAIEMTVVRGATVYQKGHIVANRGDGAFVSGGKL